MRPNHGRHIRPVLAGLVATVLLAAGCARAGAAPAPGAGSGHLRQTATTAAETGPSGIRPFPDDDRGSQQCGPYVVEWSNPMGPGQARLTVTDAAGRQVLDVRQQMLFCCERLVPFWCGPALGDDRTVLDYGYYSGGAHCCMTEYVVDLGGPRTMLIATLRNYGEGLHPAQIDDDAALELVGSSDVFAYFADLSFAASPYLPLVFDEDHESYEEATRMFPDRVRADRQAAETELDSVLRDPDATFEDAAGLALQAYGDDVLLGDHVAGLRALLLRLRAADRPDVASWLDEHARDAQVLVDALFAPAPGSWDAGQGT